MHIGLGGCRQQVVSDTAIRGEDIPSTFLLELDAPGLGRQMDDGIDSIHDLIEPTTLLEIDSYRLPGQVGQGRTLVL